MKRKITLSSLLLLTLATASVRADLLYWSANGTTVSGSPGTWNTTLARWGTDTSGPFTTVWNNANSDSATLSASGASFGSVVLGANITMNGTLSIEQTPGTWPSWTINGSSTLTYSANSILQGPSVNSSTHNARYAGTITKTGAGTILFNNSGGNVTKFILKQGVSTFSAPNRFGSGVDTSDFLTFDGGSLRADTSAWGTCGKSISLTANGGTIAPSSSTVTMNFDKPITSTGGGRLTVSSGQVTLSSTANSWTGPMTISGTSAKLILGAANVIPDTCVLTCNSTLNMANFSETISSLSGSGTVTLGSGTLTLADGRNTFSGVITGTGGLVKNGLNAEVLSGTSTFTGPTTINAGTIRLGVLDALATSQVVIASPGVLDVNFLSPTIAALSGSGVVSNNAGGTLTVNGNLTTGGGTGVGFQVYSCYSGTFTNGGLTKDGTHAMALRGSNTFDGALTFINGTLSVGAAPDRLPPALSLYVPAPALFQLDANRQALATLYGNGFVNLGGGVLTLNEGGANTFTGLIQDSEVAGSPTGLGHGLRGYYYDNIDMTTLKAVRDDASVNFSDFTSAAQLPAAIYPNTNTISVRWLGQLLTTAAGTYKLTTTCDDGSRLWVNGALVVDNWVSQGATPRSGSIDLAANTKYDLIMEYFNGTGGSSAKLLWTPPGDTATNVIPTEYLFLPGPGALVMSGAGTYTLGTAGTYSGDTIVTAGTLVAQADGALGAGNVTVSNANLILQSGATNGYMSPAASLLLNGATPLVTLNFFGAEDIRGLSYNGGTTYQAAGTYGAPGSGAAHQDARFSGSGLLNVTGAPTTTGLTSSGSPTAVYGTSLTLTATVTPSSSTGTVTFYDGALWLGSATLNGSGVAVLNVNRLSVTASPHSLKAVYGGDATHAPSTSGTVSQSTTVATLTPNVFIAIKVYDTTTNAIIGSVSFGGIVSEDTNYVNIAGTAVANFRDKNVGVGKPVDVTGLSLTGSLSGNYVMPTTSLSTTGTITNKSLTITGITATNKVYDATTAAGYTGTPALVGVISPEVVTLGGTPVLTFTNKNVGTAKPVTVSGFSISGADSGNYVLVQTNLSANISTFPITVGGVAANSKIYDGTTNATLSGTAALSPAAFGGDDVTLGGTAVAGFNNKNVGTAKPVTVSGYTLSGADAGNYALSQPAGLTANITVNATTCVVVSSANPSTVGNSVTFTATVTAGTPSVDSPTGNVVFSTNATLAVIAGLTPAGPGVATATFSSALLPVGTHTVQAQYATDGNFGASGDSLQQTVNAATLPFRITSIVPGVGSSTITYSNGIGSQFVLVRSANPAQLLSTWSRVATNTTSDGTFNALTPSAPLYWRVLGEP